MATSSGGALGSQSWNLRHNMSFLTADKQSADEFTSYHNLTLSTDDINLLSTIEGIISYWVTRREAFAVLHRCALQIYATPASSTLSEKYLVC